MLACFIKYLYIRPIRHELRKNLMKYYVSRRICTRMKSLKKKFYLPRQLKLHNFYLFLLYQLGILMYKLMCQLCHPNYTIHMEYNKKVPS